MKKLIIPLLIILSLIIIAFAACDTGASEKLTATYDDKLTKTDDGYIFYDDNGKRREIGAILRQLCEWKGVEIIEAEVCPDHVHMCLKILPKMSVSGFMGYLKGKSSVLIYSKFANMKFKYRNREFWCRGYYVDTVGKNTRKIKEYIASQLAEDKRMEQMTIFEVNDPFKK